MKRTLRDDLVDHGVPERAADMLVNMAEARVVANQFRPGPAPGAGKTIKPPPPPPPPPPPFADGGVVYPYSPTMAVLGGLYNRGVA